MFTNLKCGSVLPKLKRTKFSDRPPFRLLINLKEGTIENSTPKWTLLKWKSRLAKEQVVIHGQIPQQGLWTYIWLKKRPKKKYQTTINQSISHSIPLKSIQSSRSRIIKDHKRTSGKEWSLYSMEESNYNHYRVRTLEKLLSLIQSKWVNKIGNFCHLLIISILKCSMNCKWTKRSPL